MIQPGKGPYTMEQIKERLRCVHCGKEYSSPEMMGLDTQPYYMITFMGSSIETHLFMVCDECSDANKIQEQNLNQEEVDYSKLPLVCVGLLGRPSKLEINQQAAMHKRMGSINERISALVKGHQAWLKEQEDKGE